MVKCVHLPPHPPASSPPLLTSRSVQKEEFRWGRSHLTSAVPPPPAERCGRAEPRHLQPLSPRLYLPPFLLASARPPHARPPVAGDAPGLVSVRLSARKRRRIVSGLRIMAARALSCHARLPGRPGTAGTGTKQTDMRQRDAGRGFLSGPDHEKTQPSSKRSH